MTINQLKEDIMIENRRTDQRYVEEHELEYLSPLEQVMSNAKNRVFDVA